MIDRSFEIVCPVCSEIHRATMDPDLFRETGRLECACGTELFIILEIEVVTEAIL